MGILVEVFCELCSPCSTFLCFLILQVCFFPAQDIQHRFKRALLFLLFFFLALPFLESWPVVLHKTPHSGHVMIFLYLTFGLNIFSRNTLWLMLSSSYCIRLEHVMFYSHLMNASLLSYMQNPFLKGQPEVCEGIALGNDRTVGWRWGRGVGH